MRQYKTPLNEITRWEIIRRSQRESPERLEKGLSNFYKPKDFNNVDFEKLFTTDTFVWRSRVGDYFVTISFEGPFQDLYDRVRSWSGKNRWKRINQKLLTKCLSSSLDTENLQVDCTCSDFIYRFAFHLSRPDVDGKYGVKQNRPPKVRNVKNNKGYVCKHVLAVLYGKRWVPAAAKAWLQYIKANPELAEELIWG
jgi:hypothetical protein